MQPEIILAELRAGFGLPVQLVRPLVGGADPAATVFRADGARGPLVVKVQSVAAARLAAQVALALEPLGRTELLSPVRTSDGDPYARLGGERALVVWPLRAGRSGFEQHQGPAVLGRVGDLLRSVHDQPVPAELRALLPRDDGDDRWRAEVLEVLERFAADPGEDPLLSRMHRLVARRGSRLRRLAYAARALAPSAGEQVLCHGDLHAGNVLVGPDGSVTVIDWDTAVLARRERDLMFAGAGIVGTWTAPAEVDAFRAGYAGTAPTVVDEAAIAYFRCDRICEDAVIYARAVTDPDAPHRQEDLATLEGQFQPGDVVDQAERSLAALSRGTGEAPRP